MSFFEKSMDMTAMGADHELISILNDLIRLNHDRTEGYRKAVEQLKPTDIDLKALFLNMASASADNANALAAEVRNRRGDPASEATQSGKLYRVWMDIRSGISARDRKSIFSLCEFGEDAALRAYKMAIESDVQIPKDIMELITDQRSRIQNSHDIIKRYRVMYEQIKS